MPRVLGVDPGLTRCGLGVVEGQPGRPLRLVAVDVVRTPPEAPTAERLHVLFRRIEEWVVLHEPDAVAVERVFADLNVLSVTGTAQAAAAGMLAAARHGIPVHLHTPTEVKAAVTGNGRADKRQVTTMVTRLLRLSERPRPADAADALALAICHVWRAGAATRLDEALARRPAGAVTRLDDPPARRSARGAPRLDEALARHPAGGNKRARP